MSFNHTLVNGTYTLLCCTAILPGELAAAMKDYDEIPTGVIAVRTDYLQKFIQEGSDFNSVEDFLEGYCSEDVESLFICAVSARAYAFSYCEALDAYDFPDMGYAGPEDMQALAEFCTHRKDLLPKEQEGLSLDLSRYQDGFYFDGDGLVWSHLSAEEGSLALTETKFPGDVVSYAASNTDNYLDFFQALSSIAYLMDQTKIISRDQDCALDIAGTVSKERLFGKSRVCFQEILSRFQIDPSETKPLEVYHDYSWGPLFEGGSQPYVDAPERDILGATAIDCYHPSIGVDGEEIDDEEGTVGATVMLSRHGNIVASIHNPAFLLNPSFRNAIEEAKEELKKIIHEGPDSFREKGWIYPYDYDKTNPGLFPDKRTLTASIDNRRGAVFGSDVPQLKSVEGETLGSMDILIYNLNTNVLETAAKVMLTYCGDILVDYLDNGYRLSTEMHNAIQEATEELESRWSKQYLSTAELEALNQKLRDEEKFFSDKNDTRSIEALGRRYGDRM